MIQDINPSKLFNEYRNLTMEDGDTALFFDEKGKLLTGGTESALTFTTGRDAKGRETIFLFAIDDRKFFLVMDEEPYVKEGFSYKSVREIRDMHAYGKEIFAVFTAFHLWKWYSDNRFCGKCGEKLLPDVKERAMRCSKCGNIIYPRINPAVIVAVTRGDSLLITRYNRGYAHNALVAGFTEIGETLEETVSREVMEETGIRVKNIRYYKSQPWGMAQDILMGFFCEADGDGEIRMDENELKYAAWVKRGDIELQPNNLSLTNEMMRLFKEGRYR